VTDNQLNADPIEIVTGIQLDVVLPIPSCPVSFRPQHQASAPLRIPQPNWPPLSTEFHGPDGGTFNGVARPVVEPSPSWPWVFAPQPKYRHPLVANANTLMSSTTRVALPTMAIVHPRSTSVWRLGTYRRAHAPSRAIEDFFVEQTHKRTSCASR
jgi:hypothetical protein